MNRKDPSDCTKNFDAEELAKTNANLLAEIIRYKQTEQALRRSEAYLAEAERLSHTGSWAYDVATGVPVYWSLERCRISRFDPAKGHPTLEEYRQLHAPEDWEKLMEAFKYAIRNKIDFETDAVAEGVRSANADAVIKRVPETMSPEVAKQYGAKLEQEAPFATPDELPQYDGIIFGTPTRFGNMAGQMRNFLDQTGRLWLSGALVGKVGSVFASTGTGGGNESTILTLIPTLLHHGMIYVGLPYAIP